MAFLDLSTTSTSTESAPRLGAGKHRVMLTKLAYVSSKDKALAVFTALDGSEFLEWLSLSSEGSKKRTKAFLSHLCNLANTKHDLVFNSMADFDQLGIHLVACELPMMISLVDDTYNGQTRAILDGYFSDAITEAPAEFDPTADGF